MRASVTFTGNPCGFVVDDGDTGLFGDMRSVVRDILRPDVAVVPVGER